ncbi:MAG: peptide deformylase [Acidobacteria bacterium]|nr:peptide deformylase [Acidobacteriota bacterium]
MAARRIVQLGDPLLREVSRQAVDARETAAVIEDLRDTLHEFRRTHGFGRGISAVQIGVPVRVIYIEFEGVPYSLINPRYVRRSGEQFELWDDCFSFPDLMVRLWRSVEVEIAYEDPSGATHRLAARGALSELLQHEMDHLDGILAVDHARDAGSLCTREEWVRRFR